MPYQLLHVNTARANEVVIAGRPTLTAIGKRPVAGRVGVGVLGLDGDEQADLSVHGGPGKAVYAYPTEHFAFWQTVRAQAGVAASNAVLEPGSVGENLGLSGVLETDVWIGDVLRFPDCDLAVSEPRYPCFKFNHAMGFNQASKLMVQSAWCGFYLAVRRAGSIAAGETFELVAGPREVGIAELFRARTRPKRA